MRKSMLRVLAAVAALLPTLFAPLHAAPCAGFGDVDSTSPFCANVQWLKNRAITLGCTASTYCPDEAVSRLAMAAFMNRLGTALTPHELRVENEAADLDPDTTPIVCQTGDFLADGFARVAYVDSRFSSTANADVELAAQLVMSADAGASWIDIGPFGSRTSVAAGGRSLLADMGFANLDAGAQARFGVRITRVGAGGDDLAANRCHVRVRVFNRNEPPANQPPVVDAGSDRAIVLPAVANLSASADDDGLPDPPGALTLAWSKVSGPGTVAFGNASSVATTASFSSAGVYVLRLSASDGALDASDDITISVEDAGSLPPPPETVAPPLQAGVVGDIANDTRFLYTGPNPIQTGVAPGAIEPLHAAVLRGRVTDRAGAGLPGAVVSVAQRPELGRTLSRADGRFDLAVSGGRAVTLNYAKDGFLPVQRRVSAPPRDYRTLDDVVLIPLDSKVTPIALGSAATQVHRANSVSDANGTRTATLVVPAATTATLVMPDGSTQPIAALSVRATEYTVGTNGPAAMPAVLPPATGYTYAVELSADEASAAGAASVQFSQPLLNYVDNFLRFPVGMAVPTGYYDRGKGQWIPSPNGRVIRIAAIDQGVATVDSVGTGALPALVLSTAERQQLAQLYTVGKELWRVPIPHFTPWDHNWPYGPPTDATPPQVPDLQRRQHRRVREPGARRGDTAGRREGRAALHERSRAGAHRGAHAAHSAERPDDSR